MMVLVLLLVMMRAKKMMTMTMTMTATHIGGVPTGISRQDEGCALQKDEKRPADRRSRLAVRQRLQRDGQEDESVPSLAWFFRFEEWMMLSFIECITSSKRKGQLTILIIDLTTIC
jgi:hypothetical protein